MEKDNQSSDTAPAGNAGSFAMPSVQPTAGPVGFGPSQNPVGQPQEPVVKAPDLYKTLTISFLLLLVAIISITIPFNTKFSIFIFYGYKIALLSSLIFGIISLGRLLIRRKVFEQKSLQDLILFAIVFIATVLINMLGGNIFYAFLICAFGIPIVFFRANGIKQAQHLQNAATYMSPENLQQETIRNDPNKTKTLFLSFAIISIVIDTSLVILFIWGMSLLSNPATASAAIGPAFLAAMVLYPGAAAGIVFIIIITGRLKCLRQSNLSEQNKAIVKLGYVTILFSSLPLLVFIAIQVVPMLASFVY